MSCQSFQSPLGATVTLVKVFIYQRTCNFLFRIVQNVMPSIRRIRAGLGICVCLLLLGTLQVGLMQCRAVEWGLNIIPHVPGSSCHRLEVAPKKRVLSCLSLPFSSNHLSTPTKNRPRIGRSYWVAWNGYGSGKPVNICWNAPCGSPSSYTVGYPTNSCCSSPSSQLQPFWRISQSLNCFFGEVDVAAIAKRKKEAGKPAPYNVTFYPWNIRYTTLGFW